MGYMKCVDSVGTETWHRATYVGTTHEKYLSYRTYGGLTRVTPWYNDTAKEDDFVWVIRDNIPTKIEYIPKQNLGRRVTTSLTKQGFEGERWYRSDDYSLHLSYHELREFEGWMLTWNGSRYF